MNVPRTCRRASIASSSLLCVLIVILATVSYMRSWSVHAETKPNRSTPAAAPDTVPAAAESYVGAAACAPCHQQIYSTFERTRMGRSMTLVTPALLKTLSLPGSFYSQTLDRHFEVFARNGKLYQSEYAVGPDAKEIFRNTKQIDWIIGAGANGIGGLTIEGNALFEAPLSFYPRTNQWELSPGYEMNDLGFHRPVLPGCIACHTGRSNLVDQTTSRFTVKPFDQPSIGCENCHGPGEAHVRAETTHQGLDAGSHIVNPGRLSADLENNICMSCHEAGDSRVPRPGKNYQDFRPGEPLDKAVSVFMVPLKKSDPDTHDHVQHFFEMSMSKCYRATAGQLRCATCHNPHFEPAPEKASAYFNQKCMACHADRQCTLPQADRAKTSPADNCIGCHMPHRDAPETAHTSLTNHRILKRPGEPWPNEAFKQTTPALPDLVHIDAVPRQSDQIPAATLVEAYREIASRRPEYQEKYEQTLAQAQTALPGDAAVQLDLGRISLARDQPAEAVTYLQRAATLSPNDPAAFGYLSQALSRVGRVHEAIAASRKAVELDPFEPLWRKGLIDQYITAQQYSDATLAMKQYLDQFPEDGSMRKIYEFATH
ncbi:multiheme c-type cytochrome [Occallatibacter riparius]|uniref:Tetratricopeptide repeat protein n=1 Tax=Occallatibacter riparius TaxID=1002689 RepID=A0A9J7BSK9_9BACT|nr:multiheme c-type cytochrome [Occallatibacter riparius]UWZ85875.1 tetratricopeptide repeat protein [Occallatibacter riparius]